MNNASSTREWSVSARLTALLALATIIGLQPPVALTPYVHLYLYPGKSAQEQIVQNRKAACLGVVARSTGPV